MGICVQAILGDGPVMDNKKLKLNLATGFVWVVGRISPRPNKEGTYEWHLQGVAVDEKIAIAMCRDENYFIGPIPVNSAIPHDYVEWTGSYFPLKIHKEEVQKK